MTAALTDLPADAVLPQVCTPCMERLDARPWHRTMAVRTGPLLTGVRVNTPEAAAAVEDLLAPLLVPEMDTAVSANFSVELGDRVGDGRRVLHLVYRDHEVVGRRRESDSLLLDLVELLDEVARLRVTEQAVVHATGVLTTSGHAVLVPGRYHKSLLTRRRQLAESGLELLRSRTQLVEIAPTSLALGLYDAGLATVLDGRGDGRTSTGIFPVRTWCVPALGNEAFDLTPSQGVFGAFAMLLNRQLAGPGRSLEVLARAAKDSRFVALPELSPGALTSALLRLCQ